MKTAAAATTTITTTTTTTVKTAKTTAATTTTVKMTKQCKANEIMISTMPMILVKGRKSTGIR